MLEGDLQANKKFKGNTADSQSNNNVIKQQHKYLTCENIRSAKTHTVNKNEIIQDICNTVSSNSEHLKITKEEAYTVLSSMINKEQLLERIKKVDIERLPYKLNYRSTFKKYFEVLAHSGIIERICYDNSAKYAFTGGADGVIKCWSIIDGMLMFSLYGHTNMISDLCISKNGKYIVSVDYQGLMNIWCLEKLEILHSIQFTSEAIFCEFIYPTNASDTLLGNIFIIFSDGLVKLVEFNLNEITANLANKFMYGESIKAICITDGGRFVICGGWWPFFLIYDTSDLDKIIVAENFRIQTLCAAKNALKFAASSENRIHIYTFYSEGSSSLGNYSKKKTGTGYWKRTVNEIDKEYFVEWICFLPSFLLVSACTDSIVRIYEDDALVIAFSGESGSIYAHPFKNIFAVVGANLSIYQIITKKTYSEFQDSDSNNDCYKLHNLSRKANKFTVSNTQPDYLHVEKLFEEMIHVSLNDCQFSDDGRFFIACDDQGIIKTYSIEDPVSVPEQQFFLKDLNVNLVTEDFSETYDMYRQKNTNWKKLEYKISAASTCESCIRIENQAALTLEKDKLTEEKFKALYLSGESGDASIQVEDTPRRNFPMIVGSDRDETYVFSESSESGSSVYSNFELDYDVSNETTGSTTASSDSVVSKRKLKSRVNTQEYSNVRQTGNRRIIDTDEEEDIIKPVSKKRRIVSSSEDKISRNTDKRKLGSPDTLKSGGSSRSNNRKNSRKNKDISSSTDSAPYRRILRRDLKKTLSLNNQATSLDEIRRPIRKASVHNILSLPDIENSYASSGLFKNLSNVNSRNGRYKEKNTPLTSKSNKSKESSSRKNRSDKKLKLFSSLNFPTIRRNSLERKVKSEQNEKRISKTGKLQKSLLNTYDQSEESSVPYKRLLRRTSTNLRHVEDPESISSFESIDESFEKTLSKFSYEWMASCMIYPDTKIYFNKENYEEFMELEQRIPFSKKYPQSSGFYNVKVVHNEFIGKIPYFVIVLKPSFLIKVYEYPDSKGMICTADQYNINVGQPVSYFDKTRVVSDSVVKTDDMFITIGDMTKLKCFAFQTHAPLNLATIHSSSAARPLFNPSRFNMYDKKPITNYDIVNEKIKNNFYEKPEDLLFDLQLVNKAAVILPERTQNIAKAILIEYEQAINEK